MPSLIGLLLFVLCGILPRQIVTTQGMQCGQTPIAPNLSLGSLGSGNVTRSRIINGATARPFSWPWQIIWCVPDGNSCGFACGGTLIDENWAITAGHCVYPSQDSPSTFRVKLGAFSRTDESEPGQQIIHVKEIFLHPKFQITNDEAIFDIALIHLSHPANITLHVQPICLAYTDDTVAKPPNTAWTIGWGGWNAAGDHAPNLQQIQLPFVDSTSCQNHFPGLVKPDVMTCAGGLGAGPCGGDSGGPLMVSFNGTWYQYGLTSWGGDCGAKGDPTVFSRTIAYCDWITEMTGDEVKCQDPL